MEGNQAIGPQLKALCAIELERNDTDGAFRVLEVAERDATFAERLDIVNGIAAVLSKSSEQQYAGVELVERYANRALTEGMLPDAARLADQAAGLAAGDPTAEAVAADLSARVATALRSTDDVRSLLSLQAEHKYGISREKIAGRTLVIVGGTRDRDTEEQLKSTFGHRDVRWITSRRRSRRTFRTLTNWIPRRRSSRCSRTPSGIPDRCRSRRCASAAASLWSRASGRRTR